MFTCFTRPSQIACTVMTVHINGITCLWKFVHCIDFSVLKYFWISQCVHLFCPVLGCHIFLFIVLSWLLPSCTALIFFVCFWESWFCSPAINQICLSQCKDWFSFILLCRQEKYYWTGLLGLDINYTNMWLYQYEEKYAPSSISAENIFDQSKNELDWINIFHWII